MFTKRNRSKQINKATFFTDKTRTLINHIIQLLHKQNYSYSEKADITKSFKLTNKEMYKYNREFVFMRHLKFLKHIKSSDRQ